MVRKRVLRTFSMDPKLSEYIDEEARRIGLPASRAIDKLLNELIDRRGKRRQRT